MQVNLSITYKKQNLLNKDEHFKDIIQYIFNNLFKNSWIDYSLDTDIILDINYNLLKVNCKDVDWMYIFFDRDIKLLLNEITNQFIIVVSWTAIIFTFKEWFDILDNIKVYDLSLLKVSWKTTINNQFSIFIWKKKRLINRKEDKRLFFKVLYLLNKKKYKSFINNIINEEDKEFRDFIKTQEEENVDINKDKVKNKSKGEISKINPLMYIELKKQLKKYNIEVEKEEYMNFIKIRIFNLLNKKQDLKCIINNLYNLIKSIKNYVLMTKNIWDKIFDTISIKIELFWLIIDNDVSLSKYISNIFIETNERVKNEKCKIKDLILYVLSLHRVKISKLIIK